MTAQLIMESRLRTKIRGVVEHIGLHLDRRPRLQELADLLGMSSFHFLRTYTQQMGETPMATSRRLRLGRAWSLLASGQRVDAVAFATGYASSQALSHAFRLRFGIPPSRIPTGAGLLAVPARIEWMASRSMAVIPFRDNMLGAVEVFDDLFTAVHKSGGQIAMTQIYAVVRDTSYLARENTYRGLACVLSDEPIRGLDRSVLPGGPFAVMRMISPWPEISEQDAISAQQALEAIRYEQIEGPLLARPVVDPYRTAPQDRLWEIMIPVRWLEG